MKYLMTILAAAAFALPAAATPITTPPPVISALGGNVTAVYVYANAADSSVLGLGAPSPVSPIFCNHNSGPCGSATAVGTAANLGSRHGILTFTLDNLSSGKMYDSVNPDGAGDYHAMITSNYADFSVGTLSSAAAAAIAALPNVTFVGFEDRQASNGSDFDYNDLIFAFSNTRPAHNPGVPEPLTLSLMGAGLLGTFGLRRIRKV